MFDPITFTLGIAGSVLTNVLTDLITGESKIAQKSAIEKEVSNQLIEHLQDQAEADALKREVEQLKAFKRKIMDEVEILAGRDPTLQVSPDAIQLREPLKKPFFTKKDNFFQQELSVRLNELDQVIAQRRKELGLMTEEEGEPSKTSVEKEGELSKASPEDKEKQLESSSLKWKSADSSKNEIPRWKREFLEMNNRIRHRRSGGDSENA